jgi:hypothetical protein
LFEDLSDFINFLITKKLKDWEHQLTQEQQSRIKIGLDGIKNGNTFEHENVVTEINEYIDSKK